MKTNFFFLSTHSQRSPHQMSNQPNQPINRSYNVAQPGGLFILKCRPYMHTSAYLCLSSEHALILIFWDKTEEMRERKRERESSKKKKLCILSPHQDPCQHAKLASWIYAYVLLGVSYYPWMMSPSCFNNIFISPKKQSRLGEWASLYITSHLSQYVHTHT